MNRIIQNVRIAFAVFIMMAGCLGIVQAAAQTGETIAVAVQAGAPEVVIYQELSKAWEEQTGNRIEWVEIPQQNMHDKLVIEFSSRSGAIDATAISEPWLVEFAASGYLDALDDRISDEDRADFGFNLLTKLSYDGKLYAIPHYMFAPVLYYRTDLFEQYGLRKPTMEEPLTKEEFLAAAQAMTNGDVFGTIVEANRNVPPVHHMIEYIYREGGQIIDENRQPRVNEPPAVKGLQFMVDLVRKYKVAPPGALGFDHVDNHTLFSQGKLGMAINWPYAYSIISDPKQSTVSDKFAIALPFKAVKTTSIVGGYSLGLVSSSRKKDVAWDWIKFITSTEQLYNLRKRNFAPPVRRSELEMLQADPTLSQAQREALEVMLKAVENGTPVPSLPEWNQVSDRLSIALQEAVSGQKSPQEALDAAQEDIEKILSR